MSNEALQPSKTARHFGERCQVSSSLRHQEKGSERKIWSPKILRNLFKYLKFRVDLPRDLCVFRNGSDRRL